MEDDTVPGNPTRSGRIPSLKNKALVAINALKGNKRSRKDNSESTNVAEDCETESEQSVLDQVSCCYYLKKKNS